VEEKKSFFSFFKKPWGWIIGLIGFIFSGIGVIVKFITPIIALFILSIIIIFVLSIAYVYLYKEYSLYKEKFEDCNKKNLELVSNNENLEIKLKDYNKIKENNSGLIYAKRNYLNKIENLSQENADLKYKVSELSISLQMKEQKIENDHRFLMFLIYSTSDKEKQKTIQSLIHERNLADNRKELF
jgi:phosphate/sulfate permease